MDWHVRRIDGKIVTACPGFVEGMAEEEIADDDAELLAFLNPPPPAITSVSARQFKLQLLSSGLLDQVNGWIAGQSKAVQIAYEYSGTFVKSEPMMQAGFIALGFTDQQLEEFFLAASKI